MICNICEILVNCGLVDTLRKAQNAVKTGRVTVEGLRVANKDALLVLVHPTGDLF